MGQTLYPEMFNLYPVIFKGKFPWERVHGNGGQLGKVILL